MARTASGLWIWLNGEHVGVWSVVRGEHIFTYTQDWVESSHARAISLSLPITKTRQIRGSVVESYFENLLPDNDLVRAHTARYFSLPKTDAYSLLTAIGRDCVGAVQLLPAGQKPVGWNALKVVPVDEAEIAAFLRVIPAQTPIRQQTNPEFFRLSLAGAQDKTALTKIDEKWYRPEGATPSTHILKLPIHHGIIGAGITLFDTIANEWVCSKILETLGFPIAKTEIVMFEDQQVLIVERFDRAWQDHHQWIARLPQEDFCQAMGVPPSLKYENEGGPGIDRCMNLLSGSATPADDRLFFQTALFAYWLMAAIDGHAKNYSIFLLPQQQYAMTPLYDVLSVWPYIGNGHNQLYRGDVKQAMALRSKNAHYRIASMTARHWRDFAYKYDGKQTWESLIAIAEHMNDALAQVQHILPDNFPQRIWEPIAENTTRQARNFLENAAQGRN